MVEYGPKDMYGPKHRQPNSWEGRECALGLNTTSMWFCKALGY